MKTHLANRKVHYWAAIAVSVPALIIFTTGILLQVKKQVAWVQPPERKGTAEIPSVSFDRILAACRSVPQASVKGWDDVSRIDVRPSRGLVKVTAKSNWEIQIDSASGEVLQTAYRRSDIIEAMHDGSWFHDAAKLWVFLPAGLTLLAMWGTGIYLFFLPIRVRRRKRLALIRSRES